jgi:hypothetical protein
MYSISSFISFPNYRPLVRSNQVVKYGNYFSVEDIINHLYILHFHSHHIREVYTIFQESSILRDTLRTVRACIIQIQPVCCTIDKIHVLENKNPSVISERVIYIKMYDFTGGKRRRCTFTLLLYLFVIIFTILCIVICLYSIRKMISS